MTYDSTRQQNFCVLLQTFVNDGSYLNKLIHIAFHVQKRIRNTIWGEGIENFEKNFDFFYDQKIWLKKWHFIHIFPSFWEGKFLLSPLWNHLCICFTSDSLIPILFFRKLKIDLLCTVYCYRFTFNLTWKQFPQNPKFFLYCQAHSMRGTGEQCPFLSERPEHHQIFIPSPLPLSTVKPDETSLGRGAIPPKQVVSTWEKIILE